MKRFVSLLAALLMFSTLFVGVRTASAGHWVTQQIYWRISNQGGGTVGTDIVVRDTAYTVLAANQSDTTGSFSLNNASVWRRHDGAATTVDTAIVAFLEFQQDSSVVTANNIQSWNFEIDGRVGGYGPKTTLGQWTQIDSVNYKVHTTPAPAAVALPIRVINGLGFGNDSENQINFHNKLMAFNDLRVRVIPITTAGLMNGSVRAFIRYWSDDPE